MNGNPVCPPVHPLTDDDVREKLRAVLVPLCSAHGPTRIGKALGGVDEKTIRRARDEQTTLCLDTAVNLLLLDPHALDGILAHFGRRSVPADSVCDTDLLPAMTGAVHKLALATSPNSPAGAELHRDELLAAEPDLRGAFDHLGALLTRIDRLKQGRAA